MHTVCERQFVCESADDFGCGIGGQLFQCTGRFGGCHPGSGGHFSCPLGNGQFECLPDGQQTPFECAAGDHQCETDGRQFSQTLG